VNRITNAESRFSGGDRSLRRGGARPAAAVATAEGRKNKKCEVRARSCTAFTLIELVIVIAIILFLAGLLLAVSGFVQEKGKRSRAEAEIAAMSAALESYKADNGIYPRSSETDALDAKNAFNPNPSATPPSSNYVPASLYLYKQLSGDTNANLQPPAGARSYFLFDPRMLTGARDTTGNLTSVSYIRDPFIFNPPHSYGYSTANQASSSAGFNPTFDLWITAGGTTASDSSKWIKNW